MWSFISRLVLRLAAVRWLFKLGGLGLLIPLALILKTIGLPLLMVLMVLALPILVLLFLFGLPVILVMVFGGMLMGLIGMVLTIGIAMIKIGVLVVLPAWLIWKLCQWMFRGKPRCGDDDIHDGPPPDVSSAPPEPPAPPAAPPIDPLIDPLD